MTKVRLMRASVCAGLALIASVMIAGRAFDVTTAAQQGPPQGDKPVEQTRKNIQVLKGLPESQLFPVMNFVSVSLGFTCDNCHVKQGKDPKTGFDNWIWESDEKKEKKVAREMMLMVLALNKDADAYGIARGSVTCYTCHRGQEHPIALPSLPLTVSGHEPTPEPAASLTPRPTPTPPPTVQQVFDRYVAAVGGNEAIAKFQTTMVKGTRDATQERSFPFEVTSKGADKFLMVVQVPDAGTFTQAINGASGWVRNPRTQRALNPEELTELKRTAELLDAIKFKPTATMRLVGRRRMGDREVLVVADKPKAGVTQRFFFDAKTGLLLRITTLTDTMLNAIPEQIDFEDYRDVDGIKLPFVVRVSNIDTYYSFTRNISEVRHNVPVEDKQFDMPPAPPAPSAKP